MNKAELASVASLATSVFRHEGDTDMGAEFPTLFSEQNLQNLRIMLDEGRPVALAGFTVRDILLMGTAIRVALIGSVCTLEEYRGQGIAARLVDEVVAGGVEQGAAVILVSGTSKLYRRMGCVDAGLWRVVRVEKRRPLPRLTCTVSEWTANDVPEMYALHQAEPIRFVRDKAEMHVLLKARSLHARPARTWVCRVKGKLAAYLCATGPDRERGVLEVLEMAGSRHALLASLPAIRASSGAGAVEIETSAWDLEMEILARAWGLPMVDRGFRGTMKIVERKLFFSAIERYIASRLSREERGGLVIDSGPAVRFRYEDGELLVEKDEDLAALVFGSVEHTAPKAGTKGLGEILARLFPMPLPGYGLNYI